MITNGHDKHKLHISIYLCVLQYFLEVFLILYGFCKRRISSVHLIPETFRKVRSGFTKNLFGLTGFHSGLFFLIFFLLILTMVVPCGLLFFFPVPAVLYAVGMNLLIQLLLVLAYRHPPVVSLVLHPLSTLCTARIALHSWYNYQKGTGIWKDRPVNRKENKS